MSRNRRQALSEAERAQVARLVTELGEATAAAALGVGVRALRRAAAGEPLNEKSRDSIRSSAWVVPATLDPAVCGIPTFTPERLVLP